MIGSGSRPRWQTADRTSASRRSSGGTTAVRCLSSVDGDAPGPYPGEDRSNRSRGSCTSTVKTRDGFPHLPAMSCGGRSPPTLDAHTRVAKRQRRRLLSAPPQVRILPLVLVSPSASWPRPPPPQGGDQGSNPCGDAAPVSTNSRSPLFQGGGGGAAPPTGTRPRPLEDRSPSKRSRAGSNPAGRTRPRGPNGTDAALRTRRLEVRILSGVRRPWLP